MVFKAEFTLQQQNPQVPALGKTQETTFDKAVLESLEDQDCNRAPGSSFQPGCTSQSHPQSFENRLPASPEG